MRCWCVTDYNIERKITQSWLTNEEGIFKINFGNQQGKITWLIGL